MNNILMKILRVVAIVLMGVTAAFSLLGGAGTVCVALAAEKFGDRMALIAPYKWLYILFVLTTLAVGVMGVRAVIMLIRGRPGAYRAALTALVSGTVIGVIHIIASRLIRGASMPVDAVVYTTVLTLVYFLVLRIPGIWSRINFEKSAGDKNIARNAAGLALSLSGLLTLTVQYWAGPTHMFMGVNYADVWNTELAFIGWGLILLGFSLFAYQASPRSLSQLFARAFFRQVSHQPPGCLPGDQQFHHGE